MLAKLVTENKDCEWIYRFRANPGRPWGGIVPPSPVLAPGGRRLVVLHNSGWVLAIYASQKKMVTLGD